MQPVYIVDAVRSPIGKIGGGLAHVRPDDLAACVISALMSRQSKVDPSRIDDVVFGNVTPAQVPASLADVVSSVIGLNDLPVDLVKARRAAAGSPSTDGLYPGQFATTYGATGTTTGRSVSVALLTEGETSSVLKQLRFAEQKEKSPRVPVTVVPVGAQSTDTSGAEEFDMDTQVATIAAGGVKHLYL